MEGKTCLVTGGTSGIGYAAASALAQDGAHVVVVANKRGEVVDRIKRKSGNPNVDFIRCDLSSFSAVRALANAVNTQYPRLDVLINNAGSGFDSLRENADGVEMTFALNYLSPFLLTHLLLDKLKAGAPARIVMVNSSVHESGKIDFDDLEGRADYNIYQAYGRSKLAGLLFIYELARRLEGTGVSINAVHPGTVATKIAEDMKWQIRLPLTLIFKLFALSPRKGADTVVYLAMSTDVEGVSGKYWTKRAPISSSDASHDREMGDKLWRVSEQMTGIAV